MFWLDLIHDNWRFHFQCQKHHDLPITTIRWVQWQKTDTILTIKWNNYMYTCTSNFQSFSWLVGTFKSNHDQLGITFEVILKLYIHVEGIYKNIFQCRFTCNAQTIAYRDKHLFVKLKKIKNWISSTPQ